MSLVQILVTSQKLGLTHRCSASVSPVQLQLHSLASGRHRAARRQSGCHCSTSERSSDAQQAVEPSDLSRRHLLLAGSAGTLTAASVPSAGAIQLPSIFNEAWKGLGGGPPDLFFPDSFSGRWIVDATLTNVRMPLGEKFVPDVSVQLTNGFPVICRCVLARP